MRSGEDGNVANANVFSYILETFLGLSMYSDKGWPTKESSIAKYICKGSYVE